jgi:hypothetical protein
MTDFIPASILCVGRTLLSAAVDLAFAVELALDFPSSTEFIPLIKKYFNECPSRPRISMPKSGQDATMKIPR